MACLITVAIMGYEAKPLKSDATPLPQKSGVHLDNNTTTALRQKLGVEPG
jgi:hypothetical protein